MVSSWMVSVDFAKDGCDSVSPSTNIRRLPNGKNGQDKSQGEEIQDVEGKGPTVWP